MSELRTEISAKQVALHFDAQKRDSLATGRTGSFLHDAWDTHEKAIATAIKGSKILVIGGAGSIGRATITLLAQYSPHTIHVLDQNENGLAELVRWLRNDRSGLSISELHTFPLDFGSTIAERYLAATDPFHTVLNFAALKHVRSEKNAFSLLQMLDTNIVKHAKFLQWLSVYGHGNNYFAVSTDKAADPASLMGASKRIMEDVVLDSKTLKRATSARFANVAFSSGSLLESFLLRMSNGHALAVPRGVKRYFVSHLEAAQISTLATFVGPSRRVVIPDLDPLRHQTMLSDIAEGVVRNFGFEPVWVETEQDARQSVASQISRGRYPILQTALDTAGEKACEDFVASDERVIPTAISGLKAIDRNGRDMGSFLESLASIIDDPCVSTSRIALIDLLRNWVPTLRHHESDLNLDQRM